jgi:mannose-6-phosphate isomerase-like protein (cupin superfamily)
MTEHIKASTLIKAQGNKPKSIEEFIGRENTGTTDVSVARMKSPPGWIEPGQTPEFDEYTVVLRGLLRVHTKDKTIDVRKGESIIAETGEWVQYSSPAKEGAEYISVCVPAFSPKTVHRDADESRKIRHVFRQKAKLGGAKKPGKKSKTKNVGKR